MSTELDPGVTELIERIDTSLVVVEATKEDVQGSELNWLPEKYAQLMCNLQALREALTSKKIPRPSRGDIPAGTGLSLIKAVGEWCDNDQVLNSLAHIEDYYRYRF